MYIMYIIVLKEISTQSLTEETSTKLNRDSIIMLSKQYIYLYNGRGIYGFTHVQANM